MGIRFQLPKQVSALVSARNELAAVYSHHGLAFTFDGNLVGDLGEATAADIFGLKLLRTNQPGIDAQTSSGATAQVKATTTGRGPAFRNVDDRAEHLIFLSFELEKLEVEVVFNGPEKIALSFLPDSWDGQRSLSNKQIRKAADLIPKGTGLVPLLAPISR